MSFRIVHRKFPAWTVFACLSLVGCTTDHFRAETTLNSDGSVERAIYQPKGETPEAAKNPNLWKAVTWADEVEPEEWDGSIRDLPSGKNEEKSCYFAAWNRFPAADKIPDHYLKKSLAGPREARLKRHVSRSDYAFVTEHVWQEVLTDTVTLEDMHKACRELADNLIPVAEEVLQEALGPEYDVSALAEWFRGEGFEWFSEITDAVYDIGARRRSIPKSKFEQTLVRRLFEICGRHGLELKMDDRRQNTQNIENFAAGKLSQLIRHSSGKPLDDENVNMILEAILLKSDKEAESEENKEKSPLELAAEKVIARKYGDEEAFEQQLLDPWSRIVGVHNEMLLENPRRFHYSLTMPGIAVETSGAIVAENRVEWDFDAEEAYPLGYSMTCRSLEADLDFQQKLLGKTPLTKRAELHRFVQLVSRDAGLSKALAQCKQQESLAPLEEYRKQINSGPIRDRKQIKASRRLRRLRLWLELDATE